MFEKEPTNFHVLAVAILMGAISFLVLPSDYIGGNHLSVNPLKCIPIYALFAILGTFIGIRSQNSIRGKWLGLVIGAAFGAAFGTFFPSILYIALGGN